MKIAIFLGETQGLKAVLDLALQFHEPIDGFYADPDHARMGEVRKNAEPAYLKIKGSNPTSCLRQNLRNGHDLILFDIPQELKGQVNGLGFGKPSLQVQPFEPNHDLLTAAEHRLWDSDGDEGTHG